MNTTHDKNPLVSNITITILLISFLRLPDDQDWMRK